MKPDWVELGELESFPEGCAMLRKASGRRFVCVRRGDEVHALDDRCPHQGYPLSGGTAHEGVLTCAWHNWKFDLASGECTFGGDAVRRYPTRVEDGRVHLDLALDVEREAARVEAGLRRALLDDDAGRAVREGLRLGALRPGRSLGPVEHALGVIAADGAARAEYGFDHPLAMLADLATWIERGWLAGPDALALGAGAVGDTSKRLPPRSSPARGVDSPDDPSLVAADLAAERRGDAEERVRWLTRAVGPERTAHQALLPFVATHVLDYGHGAIFLTKAVELARRFPAAAGELLASVTVQLGWATAETALPPFAATRAGLERLGSLARHDGERLERGRLVEEILAGEKRAVAAVLAQLEAGVDPAEVLLAVAHASAVRLSRFDPSWEEKLNAEVGVLDVSHALTFCEALLALAPAAASATVARFVVLAAGFVGKLRQGDGPEVALPTRPRAPDLAAALAARDLGDALALTRDLDAGGRAAAYAVVAPFAAIEAAVRPIFQAHHVKLTEACFRLESLDPRAGGAYLAACLTFVTPRRRERFVRRTAATAERFLADGRPPQGLY